MGIVDDPVGFYLEFEIGSPLGNLTDYDIWPPVCFHYIVEIPPGSKLRYPDLAGSYFLATLMVTP